MPDLNQVKFRKIPSTIQRTRLTPTQQLTFKHRFNFSPYLDITNINHINSEDLSAIFGNNHKTILDIGFGDGTQLTELARNFPHYNFIGIELYKKGIVNAINYLNVHKLTNVKIIWHEAIEVIKIFNDKLISKVQLFFPDPWPKLSQHKRRLIQPDFIQLIKNKLTSQGILHIITDCLDYNNHIIKIMTMDSQFTHIPPPTTFRPITKFEKIALKKGNSIYELFFILE